MKKLQKKVKTTKKYGNVLICWVYSMNYCHVLDDPYYLDTHIRTLTFYNEYWNSLILQHIFVKWYFLVILLPSLFYNHSLENMKI